MQSQASGEGKDEKLYEYRSGVIVIGAPGTGKTTFCNGLQQLLKQVERDHVIVNLDPANEHMEYEVRSNFKLIQLIVVQN